MEKTIGLVDLDAAQWDDWQNIKNEWLTSYFIPCLNEYKLSQNCKDCGDIVWKVRFSIGEDGFMNGFKILDKKINCFDQEESKLTSFENCITESISKHTFSKSFSNVIFEVEIGRRTKC